MTISEMSTKNKIITHFPRISGLASVSQTSYNVDDNVDDYFGVLTNK